MKLRPHHLLCTQGYSGKGYNETFVDNMNRLVKKLRSEERTDIELVFGTDDLCDSCPNKNANDTCETNGKVTSIDQKVIDYFNLEEKHYIYQDLTKQIKENITEEQMQDICSTCSWYKISSCKKVLIDHQESPKIN